MIQIMNAALVSQGSDPIAENDGSNEFALLSRNWPLIVESELEDGAYAFSKREDHLLTRSDGEYGYDDAYAVPLDALHVRRVWTLSTDSVRVFPDWVQDGSRVHVNADAGIYVELAIVSGEDLWSANFCRGVQCQLEAVILRAIKEEPVEARDMEVMALEYFDRARTNSSKSRSAQDPFKPGRFAAARFFRG